MEATKNAYSFEDLFIEFDEMGFQPTTLCPDFEGYAIAWKERLVSLVKELQQRVSILETDNDDYKDKIAENELVSIDWHNEQVEELEEKVERYGHRLSETQYALSVCQDENAEQKAEIERLTKRLELADKDNDNLAKTIFEYEKQVDELEEQRDNQAYIAEELVQEKHRWTEQAVKDTAKEILQRLQCFGERDKGLRIDLLDIADEYGVEVE